MNSEEISQAESKAEKSGDKQLQIDLLNELSYEVRNTDIARSGSIAEKALKLSKEINSAKGKANSLLNLGFNSLQIAKHEIAFEQLSECIDLYTQLQDDLGIANAYYNLGVVHLRVGTLTEAIDSLHKSLALNHTLNNKPGQAACYFQLSFIHNRYFNDTASAFEAIFKALALRKELNDENGIGAALMGLGDIYIATKDYAKAKEVLEESMRLRQKGDEKLGYFASLNRLIELKSIMGETTEALKDISTGYKMAMEEKLYFGVVRFLQLKGRIEMQLNHLDASLEAYTEAITFARDVSFKSVEYELHEALAGVYAQKGDYKLAFENFQKFHTIKEEVISHQSNTRLKSVQLIAQIESVKRQAEIERVKNEELQKANNIIEEKNKDITDSIRYARRIQTAILPKNSFIESLFPQSFVLYKPKDIVSGDFYWTALKNGKKILVAADCTGHGVPGAFMSMMGSTLLNEIVNEKAITSAADILNHLRDRLMQTLQQTGADGESKDGMDIALCVIHENKLEFAGANNSFYLIRNGELKEFKGDKQPIGVHVGEQRPFIQHEITLHKGDNFYILTDGYADQFGGPKGKKFKYKQLEDLLLSISTLSMNTQKEKLDKEFETWKGELEQVDDVLVMGIRV